MEAEKAVVVESVPSGDLKDESVEKKSDEPLDGDIDLDLSPESAAVMVGLYPLPTVSRLNANASLRPNVTI